MTPPSPPTSLPPPTTRCPNCGTPVVAWLPASCSRCGFHVVHRDPRWQDRPLGFAKRLLMIGWPLIGFAAAFRFSSQTGFIGTAAVTLQILCFFAGFINPPLMAIKTNQRPPTFILNEPPEQTARRKKLTTILAILLAALIPLLLFGSCLRSIGTPR